MGNIRDLKGELMAKGRIVLSKYLKNLLAECWYGCYYQEVGWRGRLKIREFLEDNEDFINALRRKK